MLRTTEGTVVHVNEYKEHDRIIRVFSPDMGVITITVKGAKKQTSSAYSCTQLFACARFCFNERGGRYYLNSCEPKKIFYSLSGDMQKMSLASYFAQIVEHSVTESQTAHDVYRLYMNCLYMIAERSADTDFIKFIFEMRFTADIGMMPGLLGCADCYTNEGDLYFLINEGLVLCEAHMRTRAKCEGPNAIKISSGMFEAIRFVCLSELDKIFNFKLSEEALQTLGKVSERYCSAQLHRWFPTLEYYKSITKEYKMLDEKETKNE